MVGQLNKIMMHYGCSTGEGLKIQVSLELLTLDMEISSEPLQESYKRYGHWITAEKLIFFYHSGSVQCPSSPTKIR